MTSLDELEMEELKRDPECCKTNNMVSHLLWTFILSFSPYRDIPIIKFLRSSH
jgi:hypothetical protein